MKLFPKLSIFSEKKIEIFVLAFVVLSLTSPAAAQDPSRMLPEVPSEIEASFLAEPAHVESDAGSRDISSDLHLIADLGQPRVEANEPAGSREDLLRSIKIQDETAAEIERSAYRPAMPPAHIDPDDDPVGDDEPPPPISTRFHWRPAIEQSFMVLGLQHGYAVVAQEKTRRALAHGNFFGDYWRSIRSVDGWDDGNRFFTNYIAHPMQGALTGHIFIQNHDRARMQKFGESKQYWNDRLKALIWSTAWSTQFELGPISQSSIGNVGMYGGMGFVDLVITPTAGTAWMISEDAIDRYIIRHIEKRSFAIKAIARMFLNPMRTVANMLRFREPWYRDRPFGH